MGRTFRSVRRRDTWPHKDHSSPIATVARRKEMPGEGVATTAESVHFVCAPAATNRPTFRTIRTWRRPSELISVCSTNAIGGDVNRHASFVRSEEWLMRNSLARSVALALVGSGITLSLGGPSYAQT